MRAAIELLPDPDGEALVRRCWDALSSAGLPGRGDHQGLSNWPHVTVWESPEHVADRPGVPRADAVSPAVVAAERLVPVLGLLPVAVPVVGVAVLGRPDRGVVVVELAAPALQAVHAEVAAVAGEGVGWRRDRWRPHLSLSRALRADQVEEALAVVTPLVEPAPVVPLTRLRTWDPAEGRSHDVGDRVGEWSATQVTEGRAAACRPVDHC